MLERATARVTALAERRAQARRQAIARAIAIPGVRVRVEDEAVVLEGRGLVRRSLLEPDLRWQMMEARHGG